MKVTGNIVRYFYAVIYAFIFFMEEWIMIRFNNDYNHTAHEKVLEAVMNTRSGSYVERVAA